MYTVTGLSKKPKVKQPQFIEQRDNQFLLIWGDIPNWMVVDGEALAIIKLSNGERTYQEIAESVVGDLRNHPTPLEDLHGFYEVLENARVMENSRPLKSPLNPIIENITINVTNRCNLRCTHCFIGESSNRPSQLDTSAIERFIQDGKEYIAELLTISILGGEPLLEKEKTLEIASIGKHIDVETVVSTNGLLIDNEFAKQARELNLVVQVSLEGSTPALNDMIRGKGSFERAVKGVRTLVENGAYSIICMVMRKDNLDDMESFCDLAIDLGVNELRFIEMREMGRVPIEGIQKATSREIILATKRLLNKRPEVRKFLVRDHFSVMKYICSRANKRSYCGAAFKTVLIDSDAGVYPCPNHVKPEFLSGNIHTDSFEEIWLRSDRLKEIRSSYFVDTINPRCSECAIRYWCLGGCRGETYEQTGIMDAVGHGCADLKAGILETFWSLSEGEEIVDTRTEYF